MCERDAHWIVAAFLFMVFAGSAASQPLSGLEIGDKEECLPLVRGNHVYLSSYPSAGLGRLHAAVQEIGSDSKVLHLDIDDQLGDGIVVPENINVVHMGGSVIDLNDNPLSLEGAFMAEPAQVFDGTGMVNFSRGSVSRILPQWWGENDSESVQRALTSTVGCGAELFLPPGTYVFDTPVEHLFTGSAFAVPGLSIRGSGPGNTIIDNQTAGKAAFHFATVNSLVETGLFLSIHGFEITSTTGSGSQGIYIHDIWLGQIDNCFIHDLAGDGILMSSDQNDFGLPKTWRIERTLIYKNNGYGICLESLDNLTVAYNIVMDQIDVEMNKAGGVYAAAELTKITNSLFAYNGTSSFSHGGIHITGLEGYAVTENVIEGNGFEANYPYDIYADCFLNLKIAQNDMSRIPFQGSPKPDNFICLNGTHVGINAVIADNHFVSANPNDPFTAILGGATLESVALDNNRFNIMATDKRYEFDPVTKVTYRVQGDTVWTNQTLGFANSVTGETDTFIKRASAGIMKVTGGVANALQTVYSTGNRLEIDCSKGLNVGHTLTENTMVLPPQVSTDSVILNLFVFQGPGSSYTIDFDPIFKLAEPFNASALHFSSIRFLYTGLYWIQLGGAAIDAPL